MSKDLNSANESVSRESNLKHKIGVYCREGKFLSLP
jgi:hypothetical protein